ncbi:MAG: M28 family peptidase, partial [Vicinamibacterales bacterium]|nr:M28 family peptidase [Vicinamibacterales bacterium]
AVVDAWAEAVPRPAGTSLAYEVYKRLPNDSDFTEFKRMNVVGLNFAFINNVQSYHTPLDSADALDRGSVQGHGDIALSLARRFGDANLDLKDWRSGDAVFFSLPGGWVVRYSAVWAWPLLAAALLLSAWATILVRSRGDTSYGGLMLAVLLIGAFYSAFVWIGLKVPGWIEALQAWLIPVAAPEASQAHALGVVCLTLSGWAAFYTLMRMKFAAHTWALASAWLVLLASGVLTYALPGASYLLFWPACVALLVVLVSPSRTSKSAAGAGAAFLLAVAAAPALAILVPTATTVFTALLLSPEGTAGMIVLAGLGVLALACQVEVVTEGRRWWPAGILALLGIGALAAGVVTSAHGDGHPRPENLIYALDADAGKALWATPADPASPWLEQYVSNEPRRGPLAGFSAVAGQAPYLSRDAPTVGHLGPEATLERNVNEAGGRVLTVRIRSPRRARALSLRMPDREVYDTAVNGRRPARVPNQAPWAPGRWGLEFTNVPPDGIVVVVRVKGNGPVTLVVADRSDGLPPALTADKNPRPPSSHPIHRGDMTVVQKAYTF